MTIKEILNNTAHRPYPIPKENWKFYQEWNNAVFLHWQVELHELQRLLPAALEIDLFDGKPWVSLVAFTMEKVRPRYLPSFAPISNFDEINIRTYVKKNNKAGVYFLSIEAGTRISCKIARALSGLPYRFSKIKRSASFYRSENASYNDQLKLAYKIGNALTEKTALDKWLTERYALFQETQTSLNEFEIHHVEWPLDEIALSEIEIVYPRFINLLNDVPDKKHYSTGVQVLAWDKKKVEKRATITA